MTDRLIPESELKPVVKQILAELFDITPAQQHQRQWYKASQAFKLLDLDNIESLHKRRKSGELKEGEHWRDVSSANAGRANYHYHVGNCREFFESDRN